MHHKQIIDAMCARRDGQLTLHEAF